MRKYLFVVLFFFTFFTSNGQIGYRSLYYASLTCNPHRLTKLSVVGKDTSNYSVGLSAFSMDGADILDPSSDGEFIIHSSNLEEFKIVLQQARSKYIEWRKIAINNHVKSLTKNMGLTTATGLLYMYNGSPYISSNQVLSFYFFIEPGNTTPIYQLAIVCSKVSSSEGEGRTTEGHVIMINSLDYLDKLLSKLDTKKMVAYLLTPTKEEVEEQQKAKQEALFKD